MLNTCKAPCRACADEKKELKQAILTGFKNFIALMLEIVRAMKSSPLRGPCKVASATFFFGHKPCSGQRRGPEKRIGMVF